jgi:O-antigen/teichoic acid export membrane protein
VLADLAVSAVFTMVMLRWFRPLIRLVFSRALLAEALRNGLPRVPHGILQQAMFVADRYALRVFSVLSEVGLYQMGASFGMALKLVLNAFEYAWAPFYYSTMKTPDAKPTFRLVTTYGVAGLTLLVAGLAATGPEIVRWVLPAEFHGAADVVPWVGLGVGFQGLYLLTSIGLNITKSTHLYPVATGAAAAASVSANVLLVPRFGSLGAAWANAVAYFVMFATAFVLSQRVYPIPLEWGRLARIVAAGGAAFGAALLVPALPPLAAALARGTVVTVAFPGILAALGFLDARELRTLGRLADRVRALRAAPAPAAAATDVTLADDQQIP